jgi:hypothetical protein
MIRQMKLLDVPAHLLDVTPEPVEAEPPVSFAHLFPVRQATGGGEEAEGEED